jgi:hypothetical protein
MDSGSGKTVRLFLEVIHTSFQASFSGLFVIMQRFPHTPRPLFLGVGGGGDAAQYHVLLGPPISVSLLDPQGMRSLGVSTAWKLTTTGEAGAELALGPKE